MSAAFILSYLPHVSGLSAPNSSAFASAAEQREENPGSSCSPRRGDLLRPPSSRSLLPTGPHPVPVTRGMTYLGHDGNMRVSYGSSDVIHVTIISHKWKSGDMYIYRLKGQLKKPQKKKPSKEIQNNNMASLWTITINFIKYIYFCFPRLYKFNIQNWSRGKLNKSL